MCMFVPRHLAEDATCCTSPGTRQARVDEIVRTTKKLERHSEPPPPARVARDNEAPGIEGASVGRTGVGRERAHVGAGGWCCRPPVSRALTSFMCCSSVLDCRDPFRHVSVQQIPILQLNQAADSLAVARKTIRVAKVEEPQRLHDVLHLDLKFGVRHRDTGQEDANQRHSCVRSEPNRR